MLMATVTWFVIVNQLKVTCKIEKYVLRRSCYSGGGIFLIKYRTLYEFYIAPNITVRCTLDYVNYF